MASVVQGRLIVPVWVDDDVVKAIVDDNGRIPINIGASGVTVDVNIESSDIDVPVTIDAATIDVPVSIDAQGITVEVEEQSPLTSIQAQAYGWDTAAWHKLAMLWGFSSRQYEDLGGTMSSASYSSYTTNVPAGYVFVVQTIYCRNTSRATTTHNMQLRDGATVVTIIEYVAGVARWIPTIWHGEIVLEEGDNVGILITAGGAGDTIEAGAWGYLMKVDE